MEETVEKTSYTNEEVELIKNELNDKYMRLFAEFENYKKRVQKEKEEIKMTTKVTMLSSILDLDSDLSIAVKNEAQSEGMKLIMSKLEKFLNSQGVESIQTEKYDSDVHEVISVVGDGTRIIDVVGKGYSLNGKAFKFPKVIIGK